MNTVQLGVATPLPAAQEANAATVKAFDTSLLTTSTSDLGRNAPKGISDIARAAASVTRLAMKQDQETNMLFAFFGLQAGRCLTGDGKGTDHALRHQI